MGAVSKNGLGENLTTNLESTCTTHAAKLDADYPHIPKTPKQKDTRNLEDLTKALSKKMLSPQTLDPKPQ